MLWRTRLIKNPCSAYWSALNTNSPATWFHLLVSMTARNINASYLNPCVISEVLIQVTFRCLHLKAPKKKWKWKWKLDTPGVKSCSFLQLNIQNNYFVSSSMAVTCDVIDLLAAALVLRHHFYTEKLSLCFTKLAYVWMDLAFQTFRVYTTIACNLTGTVQNL